MKYFSIDSQGNKLRGFVMKPKGKGPFKTVIVSHGFGENQALTHSYAKVFVKKGYCAFIYDFPAAGNGISGGKTTTMSVLTEKRDLINLVDYVRAQDFVDKDHIILAGLSQGGLVSALAAPEVEDKIERIMLYYPALCIPDDARRGVMITAHIDPENVPESFYAINVKLGKKYVEDARSLDPYEQICTFSKPVWIIHGKEDPLVKIDYSRKAAERYPNATLVEIHGDHGFIFAGKRRSNKETAKYLDALA